MYQPRLGPMARQSGLLCGADGAEELLSTALEISRSYSGHSSNNAGPQDRYQVIVAMDEQCCAILRWGDADLWLCYNVPLWGIAYRLVVIRTSPAMLVVFRGSKWD